MTHVKRIYENKYFTIYLFMKAWLLGIGNNLRGDIQIFLPFFIVNIKKDNIKFVREYGEVTVFVAMIWLNLILLSKIFL